MANNEATLEEVECFLNEFQEKSRIYGVVYNDDKPENLQTLADLEIFPYQRTRYLLGLKPTDYYQGPDINLDDDTEGEVWMFGIGIKRKGKGKKIPIYIKIYITKIPGTSNFCISFHIARFEMKFPYKDQL